MIRTCHKCGKQTDLIKAQVPWVCPFCGASDEKKYAIFGIFRAELRAPYKDKAVSELIRKFHECNAECNIVRVEEISEDVC